MVKLTKQYILCHARYLFVLAVLLFFIGCFSAQAFAQEKIIAVVNNDVITQKDFIDFTNFMRMQLSAEYSGEDLENKIRSMKVDLLNRLIEDRLIISEARKSNINVDVNRIKAKISEIKKHYSSDHEFQESLKNQGMVQADLELKIKEQLMMYSIIDAKVRSKIAVTPFEVTDYYQKNTEEFESPIALEFDALTLEEKNKADEISNEIKRGQSFEGLAEKFSLSINKLNMKKGEFKMDVEGIVFKLKPQEVSEPVKIENKYYLFKLIKAIPAQQQSLSEAQESIYAFLYNKKMQEGLTKWLNALKKQSYIKNMPD